MTEKQRKAFCEKIKQMTEEQRKAFGNEIKHLIIDKNIKQREIAEAACVSEPFLSMVLSGVKKPPFDLVVAISKKLGVTVDSLIK